MKRQGTTKDLLAKLMVALFLSHAPSCVDETPQDRQEPVGEVTTVIEPEPLEPITEVRLHWALAGELSPEERAVLNAVDPDLVAAQELANQLTEELALAEANEPEPYGSGNSIGSWMNDGIEVQAYGPGTGTCPSPQCELYPPQCVGFDKAVAQALEGWCSSGCSFGGSAKYGDDEPMPSNRHQIKYISGTSKIRPNKGDHLIFDGTDGHVAAIESVTSGGVNSQGIETLFLTVVEQNWPDGQARHTIAATKTAAGVYTVGNRGSLVATSWLRAGQNWRSEVSSTNAFGWTVRNGSSQSIIGDNLRLSFTGTDPGLVSPAGLKLAGNFFDKVRVGLAVPTNCTGNAQLFWKRTTDAGFDETRSLSLALTKGSYQIIEFNVSTRSDWRGARIDQVRLDPSSSCAGAALVDVDFIEFRAE